MNKYLTTIATVLVFIGMVATLFITGFYSDEYRESFLTLNETNQQTVLFFEGLGLAIIAILLLLLGVLIKQSTVELDIIWTGTKYDGFQEIVSTIYYVLYIVFYLFWMYLLLNCINLTINVT